MFKKLLVTTAAVMFSSTLASGVNAADFGGDCCADLEERVAVLEATTARKGNRKVSLTISGVVYQQLMIWDDGIDSDAYVVDQTPDAGTHFKFSGNAKINHDWSAGYEIKITVDAGSNILVNADDDDAGAGLGIDTSFIWIKSEQLGRLSIGQQSHATDNVGFIDLSGGGSAYAANLVSFDAAGFQIIAEGSATRSTAIWGDIAYCQSALFGIHNDCVGDRTNSIRYDSPTIAGFVFSASWGEDDFYDVALRWNGELGQFKVSAGIGYQERDDELMGNTAEVTQGALTFIHMPTGIFFTGVVGQEEVDDGRPDTENFYLKAGVRQKWNSLGATVIYGEYGASDDGFNPNATFNNLGIGAITSSEFERYGVGIVQEIDAASMAVFAKWKRMDGEVTDAGGTTDLEEIDIFGIGGVLFF